MMKGTLDFDLYILDRLATYDDVRNSYPLSRVPKSLQAKEEKAEWWLDNFESQLGLLHKINWHRIVLDGKFHQ